MAAQKKNVPTSPDETVHHESARKKRKAAAGGGMSLNLTPMIDVTFQLLIFFVVTANFIREGLLISQLPTDAPATTVPNLPLKIGIDDSAGSPRITVNGKEAKASIDDSYRVYIKMDQAGQTMPLADYLKALDGQGGFSKDSTPVMIEPGARAEWQYTLGAYNSVVSAGYQKISWVLKQ